MAISHRGAIAQAQRPRAAHVCGQMEHMIRVHAWRMWRCIVYHPCRAATIKDLVVPAAGASWKGLATKWGMAGHVSDATCPIDDGLPLLLSVAGSLVARRRCGQLWSPAAARQRAGSRTRRR